MRVLVGCSIALGLIAFLIAFAATLVVGEATWMDSLMMAAMTGGITVAAALLLFRRDFVQRTRTVENVRTYLLACDDMSDDLTHAIALSANLRYSESLGAEADAPMEYGVVPD